MKFIQTLYEWQRDNWKSVLYDSFQAIVVKKGYENINLDFEAPVFFIQKKRDNVSYVKRQMFCIKSIAYISGPVIEVYYENDEYKTCGITYDENDKEYADLMTLIEDVVVNE